jgi:hypothetical protein
MDVLVFVGEPVAIELLTYPPDTQAIPFTLPLGSISLSSVLVLFSASEKVLCILICCNRLECPYHLRQSHTLLLPNTPSREEEKSILYYEL